MKTFSEWHSLLLLKKWDDYLLTHYPVVWRTKALFVLVYGLLGAIVLFAAGYFYPIDAQHLSVDPVKPIDISTDLSYLFVLLFISFGLFYWAYQQHQLGFLFTKMKHVLLTLAIYVVCFWVVLGFTAPAFRMGTIVRTANWINQEDLDTLENSGIYPYGFVFLNSDTSMFLTDTLIPTDSHFFQRRERVMDSICAIENILLQNRYNTDSTFWIKWFSDHHSYKSYKSYLSDISYRSYLSYQPYPSYQSDMLYMSYRSNLSLMSCRSYLSDISYLSHLSHLLYRSDLLDRANMLYLADRSNMLYRADISYRSDILTLSSYNYQKNLPKFTKIFDTNKFMDTIECIKLPSIKNSKDSLIFTRPTLPFSIENTVRSVKHASLYLDQGIYWKYLGRLSLYIPFFIALFFLSTHLSFKNAFISLAIVIGEFIIILYFDLADDQTYNKELYLFLPTIGLVLLCLSFLKKRYHIFESFAVNLISIAISFSVFYILINELFHKNEVTTYPNNNSFFGMQIIGFLAVLLITYVRSLPKVR